MLKLINEYILPDKCAGNESRVSDTTSAVFACAVNDSGVAEENSALFVCAHRTSVFFCCRGKHSVCVCSGHVKFFSSEKGPVCVCVADTRRFADASSAIFVFCKGRVPSERNSFREGVCHNAHGTVMSTHTEGQHILRGVRGAVLALVVRQYNASFFIPQAVSRCMRSH